MATNAAVEDSYCSVTVVAGPSQTIDPLGETFVFRLLLVVLQVDLLQAASWLYSSLLPVVVVAAAVAAAVVVILHLGEEAEVA